MSRNRSRIVQEWHNFYFIFNHTTFQNRKLEWTKFGWLSRIHVTLYRNRPYSSSYSLLILIGIVLSNRQCQCDLYVISTTLYRSLHVVHTYTHYLLCIFHIPHIAYYLQLSFCISSQYTHVIKTSSIHYLYIICTATHGQHGPELSFTVTGICYWMEFVAGMLNCSISGLCKWFVR